MMKQFFGKFLQKDNTIPEKPNQSEPILALSISAGTVKAAIWELQDHTIEIIGLGVKTYSEVGREKEVDYKALSDKTAEAIDLACTVAEVDIKKTFFGLPQSWFKGEDIYPDYNALLEKLASSLDLEAIAYVSIPHAISYYLQYLHKTPTTALLIGSAREGAQICYVEQGKIKEEHYITWAGGSLGKNIDKGLMQFTSIKEFPASIFIYGYGDLNAARDDISRYGWTAADRLGANVEAPKFLSSPKVTVLEQHVDSLAVALVGGKDYARHHQIQGRLDIKSLEYASMNTQAVVVPTETHALQEEGPEIKAEEHHAHAAQPLHKPAISDNEMPFGFVMDSDVHSKSEHSSTELPSHIDEPEDEELELEEHAQLNENETESHHHQFIAAESEAETENEEEHFMPPAKQEKKPFKLKLPFQQRNLRQIGLILAVLLILLLGGGGVAAWAYWNVPQATVTVYVKPDTLEKQVTLVASEKTTTTSATTIPAQKISFDVKDTKEASTTGKRTTGDVAKGQVNIINKTGTVKRFDAGTEIRTANLKFKLSEDVTVASASSTTTSEGETKTYGKSAVNVVATDIGPDGNVDKDTSFSIPSFTKDDFEGVALAKFTGGIKKDIKVVSSSDRTNLSKDLRSDIELKIPEQIRAKVGADQTLLEQAWQISVLTEKFNKSVNDESPTVSVDLTLHVDAYAFKKSDVEQVLSSVSESAVPSDYELKDSNKNIRTNFVSLDKDGTLHFSATSSVNIIPKINEDDIAQSILGKKQDAALETIMSNKKIADVTFDYSVRLPEMLQTLPHIQKNIKVVRGVR